MSSTIKIMNSILAKIDLNKRERDRIRTLELVVVVIVLTDCTE